MIKKLFLTWLLKQLNALDTHPDFKDRHFPWYTWRGGNQFITKTASELNDLRERVNAFEEELDRHLGEEIVTPKNVDRIYPDKAKEKVKKALPKGLYDL